MNGYTCGIHDLVEELREKMHQPAPGTWFYMMEEFTRGNGYEIPRTPTADLTPEVALLRLHLMMEELGEVSRALNQKDLQQLADGLADLLYVVIGTATQAGLGPVMPRLFAEVHRSNMTKDLGPRWPGDRGARKGDRYEPPRLGEILDDYLDELKKIYEVTESMGPISPNFRCDDWTDAQVASHDAWAASPEGKRMIEDVDAAIARRGQKGRIIVEEPPVKISVYKKIKIWYTQFLQR